MVFKAHSSTSRIMIMHFMRGCLVTLYFLTSPSQYGRVLTGYKKISCNGSTTNVRNASLHSRWNHSRWCIRITSSLIRKVPTLWQRNMHVDIHSSRIFQTRWIAFRAAVVLRISCKPRSSTLQTAIWVFKPVPNPSSRLTSTELFRTGHV